MSYRGYGSTLLVSALLLFGCSTALYQASQPPGSRLGLPFRH